MSGQKMVYIIHNHKMYMVYHSTYTTVHVTVLINATKRLVKKKHLYSTSYTAFEE